MPEVVAGRTPVINFITTVLKRNERRKLFGFAPRLLLASDKSEFPFQPLDMLPLPSDRQLHFRRV